MPPDFQVLVASSSVDMGDLLMRRLQRLGCRVQCAESVTQATRLAAARMWHLALVAWHADRAVAQELVAELRRRKPGMPVVLLETGERDGWATEVRADPLIRCLACPSGDVALDNVLEEAIEMACAAPRTIFAANQVAARAVGKLEARD